MLTFRDGTHWDIRSVAGVLAAAMVPTRLGRWLEREPSVRGQLLFGLYEAGVAAALRDGAVRLVEDGEQLVAAALWLPCGDDSVRTRPTVGGDSFAARLRQLEHVSGRPHPPHSHLELAGVGVALRWQRHGIATRLLTEHEVLSSAALCVIADEAVAVLAAGCGYRPCGAAVRLTTDTIVQPMLFSTEAGVVRRRNAPSGPYRADAPGSTAATRGTTPRTTRSRS